MMNLSEVASIDISSQQKKPKQSVNGILLLDKPTGITSNAALQRVKYLFNAKKAGHTGSLDPLASGMLPLCFGEATKFSQFLLDADKEYIVVAQLGIRTTTGDAEGEVLETKPIPEFTEQAIEKCLQKYRGNIMQIPSMYSALKHKGQPLYKLARQGIEVERKARSIKIFKLDLLDRKSDSLTLAVHCSKGTYVRTLVEDIGEFLGCGAHVVYLRRTVVRPYEEQQMITISQLEQAQTSEQLKKHLLPIDSAVKKLPEVILTSSAEFYIGRGQTIFVANAPANSFVRLVTCSGSFIGVGEVTDSGKVAPRRIVNS